MKKIATILLLFITAFAQSQNDYSNVLNLLIGNKREEARKQFDRQFGKTKQTNIDLLFLDAFINQEMGQIDFDDSFIRSIENLPNSEYFVPAFANSTLVLGDISKDASNDLTYIKADFLASSPKFSKLPIVKYRKAILDRKRYKYDEAARLLKEFEVIQQWQFCGVFENLNGSGLNIEYEPELYAKNDKIFDANSNGKVNWYIPKAVQDEVYHAFANEGEYGAGIMYAQTFIESPEKKEYLLRFGSNSALKIFLNDKEIYLNQDIFNTNLDAYTIKIPLEKGYNRLLFKIDLGGQDYFSAQLKNLDYSVPNGVKYSATFQQYPVLAGGSEFTATEIKPDFELYFDDLVQKNPNNVLYQLYQFTAYEANNKKNEAFEAIEKLNAKYPNSSMIAAYMLRYYDMDSDQTEKSNEVLKNLEVNDPNYYFVSFTKLLDKQWLMNAPIEELEKYRDSSKKFKQLFVSEMYDFIITSRKSDMDGMLNILESILSHTHNNEQIQILAANLHLQLKNDKDKTLATLEAIVKKIDSYEAGQLLISCYNEMNRKDDVIKIIKQRINAYAYMNSFRTDYAQMLINDNQYQKALEVIDENLAYFPYSFSNMEKKATIYSLMKNDKEAEKSIRQSLIYNSGNSSLRKVLYDITKTPDEITEVATKNIYKVIKDRRKSTLKNDYGVVLLLDEFIVNVLPEGGRKSKVVYLYEITAENGIEEMKEYSINSSFAIVKSEIVRIDGSIVPAERGDGMLVFADLRVGDVIYIEYETFSNAVGRFYKDFNVSAFFDSNYPSVETIFAVINPADIQYNTAFSNGKITPQVKKINNKTCTIWKRNNIPSMVQRESYAPVANDLTNVIHVGTIKSWNDISNWYADLVKKSLKLDKITKEAFTEIFPKGTAGISQEEIAKKIYTYIETKITYSSLDFRQSGYVPQKPSKTITTKLGDCKDVSTLFVALADLAGLKSNLVLVTTNDYGFNSMLLPSNDFNHCIVKVNIDAKDVFLELTNKFLPFRALPNSLYGAKALVISFDKNEKAAPINIPFDQAVKNTLTSVTTVQIDEKSKKFDIKKTVQGANKSYYSELFAESTTDDVRKKQLTNDYNDVLKKVVSLQSVKLLNNEPFESNISFESQFSITEKPQEIGSLKITGMPFLDHIYTRAIIEKETRNYDISYFKYENNQEYNSTVFIDIPEGKKFIEIPESKNFEFKGHKYSLVLEQVKPNSLKVTRTGITPWNTISAADYPLFKKYVEDVIEAEEKIIGYK